MAAKIPPSAVEERRDRGQKGDVLQIGPIQRVQLFEVAHAQRGGDGIDVGGANLQVLHEEVAAGRRHGGIHGDAHDPAEASLPYAPLDRLQEVLRLELLNGQLGIPRHPEGVDFDDVHSGEEAMQVGGDDLFHPDEEPGWPRRVLLGRLARHTDGHEPRQGGGTP